MDVKFLWFSLVPLVVINSFFIISMLIFPLYYPKIKKVDFVEDRHSSKILGKWIRHWWVWITTPIFKLFLHLKLTPNQISSAGTVMGLFSALAFAFTDPWIGVGSFGLGGWLMVFGASLDFMDGRMARETGQESLAGAFFDSVMDRVSECFVFAGLAWYFRDSWTLWLVMAAFTGAMLTSYAKCRGDKMGAVYEGGTMQRPERIVYTGVGGILAPVFALGLMKFFPGKFADIKAATDFLYAFPIGFVALMSNYTTVNRITNIMKILDQKEADLKRKRA